MVDMTAAIEDILRDALEEVEGRIRAIEDSLVPVYAEREKVLRALAAIASPATKPVLQGQEISGNLINGGTANPFASLTMKELIIKALLERFENGATAAQLLSFFSEAWGRKDIMRSSFSPQLSRLKNDGVIVLNGKVWSLASDDVNENEPPKGGSETSEGATSLFDRGGIAPRP